jgi:hypothetical protein
MGSPEYRGWWVYVPTGYDPTKPYKVIYNGANCGSPDNFSAGAAGYPYDSVDGGNAILVGLDYDTYATVPYCYDDQDPQSNDFEFFPWLQSQIEASLCVDMNREFFSGYNGGAWLAQQLSCAFPDKLRGVVSNAGCEPAGTAGSLPACVQKPTAAFFVHDPSSSFAPLQCILPACTRMLEQNGCSVTHCDPTDTTITTPYPVPTGVSLPAGGNCVQFNGCPANYPVVFCLTPNQNQSDGRSWGIVNLFWDWMNGR